MKYRENQNLTNIALATKLGKVPYENFGVNHSTYLKSEELPSKLRSVAIHIDPFQYLMLKVKEYCVGLGPPAVGNHGKL